MKFNSWRNRSRSGVTLFVVMICLLAVSTILVTCIGVCIRQRTYLKTETQLEQTYWLLDAGIGRAIKSVKIDDDSSDFELKTESLLQKYDGTIEVMVLERLDEKSKLRVTARLKRKNRYGAVTQRSKVFWVDHE